MQNQNSEWGSEISGFFPLLIKFLDAAQDLSVQVHPDEAYCRSHPGAHLKSEAWYILHAEPGAKIYKGVKAGVTQGDVSGGTAGGAVEPLLNAIKVRTGDCHYLPSGTVTRWGRACWWPKSRRPATRRSGCLTGIGSPRTGSRGRCMWRRRWRAFSSPPAEERLTGSGAPGAMRLAECEHFTIDRVANARGTCSGRWTR